MGQDSLAFHWVPRAASGCGNTRLTMNDKALEKPIKDDRNGKPYYKSSTSAYKILDIEIENGYSPYQVPWKQEGDIQLYHFRDLPQFLRNNPHIFYGYRAFLPFGLCLKSMFMWSNETINIWSHFLGCILFFLLMFYDNFVFIPSLKGSYIDHFMITVSLLCFQFCLLSSAGFHLFMCHSEKANSRWLQIDLAGIIFGMIGCYVPGVHYAFYCFSIWRDIYFLTVLILSIGVLCMQLNPRFAATEWWNLRLLLYCSLVAYGLIPTTHWIYLNGGWSHTIVKMFLPKVVLMYLLELFAFFFYISKCPERCLPGKVDFLGSSHQIWHVILVAGFFYWHQAGKEILQYRINNQCV
ncbi:progestin and adipoQ receptor family member 3-like [Tubulanus polymorphus]|uniref:progestin and adipoQ receptor family member 3-like n=1 Tax=Tubulanus polymorphus TaxID=672921 RepID=UPI003DA48D7B